jgi:hypothetical protein
MEEPNGEKEPNGELVPASSEQSEIHPKVKPVSYSDFT